MAFDGFSLKYCAEKRLLKTHVAFFMKVTVVVLFGRLPDKFLWRKITYKTAVSEMFACSVFEHVT
jgi:hypothetical protein